jgi:hypothetical protein
VAIAATLLVLSLVSMTPLYQEFFIGILISVFMLRILWLFEAERLYQVLAGYELDQGLVLRQSEKSLLTSLLIRTRRVSTVSVVSSDPESQHYQKYSTQRSKEELDMEIRRLQEEIKTREDELAYVENMIFVIADSSASSGHYKPDAASPVTGKEAAPFPADHVAGN